MESLRERDRLLLELIAENRFALIAHAARLLGISPRTAAGRLRGLRQRRLAVSDQPPPGRAASWRATRAGLRLLGNDLPPAPAPVPGTHRHDAGVAWLYVAARRGAFGAVKEVVTERRLRSEDATPEERGRPSAVRIGGLTAELSERLHYPDLILHTASGHRVALELELSVKDVARRNRILQAYAADRRIDAVVYLVENRAAGRRIARTAASLGISDLVSVQMVSLPSRSWPRGGGRARTAVQAAALAASGREGP